MKKNKVKLILRKITAVFLVMLTICSISTPAFAADFKGKVYEIDLPRGSDPNRNNWGHPKLEFMSGWYMKSIKKDSVIAVGDYEGNTCYCLEPGVSIHTGSSVTQKGEDYWNRFPENDTITSRDIKQLIGRILQYGWTGKNNLNWNSKNSSHRNQLGELLATKALIYETVVGERDANFNKINARNYGKNNVLEMFSSKHPCYSEIMSHYQDIERKVKNHTTVPSFCSRSSSQAPTAEMNYDGNKYTVTLYDKNGVLSNYNFSTTTSGISISQNGNSLTISTSTPPTSDISIKANKKQSYRKALVTWTDGNVSSSHSQTQDLVTYGKSVNDPVQAFLKVKVSAGNCNIQKVAEDGFKAGFNFEVKGNNFSKTVTTDSNGTFQLTNIPAGDYTITEKLTSEQSRYVQPETQYVTVYPGKTASISFENKLKRGVAQFKKTDIETDKEIESKDGVFGVYSWNKQSRDYERVEQMTYSEKKQAYTTTNLPVTYKNDGWYKVVEEVAPTGYANPTLVEYEFRITQDGQVHHINDGTITNIPQKGKVHIVKQGEVLDDFDFMQTEFGLKYSPIYKTVNLPGSVWEIRALEDVVVNGDIKYHKDELVQKLTTTENGVTSSPLYLGKYVVREIKAPNGYFIGSNEFEIELTYHDQHIDVFTESYVGYNARQQAKVQIQKDVEENIYYPNPEAYKDIVFGIFSDEDITDWDGNVILEKDSLVDCFGINESGQGISSTDLPINSKWYVKELQTSEGYILNKTKYPFAFETRPQDIPLVWIDINNGEPIENNVIKGNLDLIKKSDFDGKLLEGAVYGIFRASDDFKVDEIVTDKNGYAKSNIDLYYGAYYIKELTPPPHYYIDENRYDFFIGADGEEYKTIHYDFTDTPKIGALVPIYKDKGIKEAVGGGLSPYTGNNEQLTTGLSVSLIAGTVSGIILIVLSLKKRKKNNS